MPILLEVGTGTRSRQTGEIYAWARPLDPAMSDSITLELLHPDARAPERATEDSAGYDLFAYLTHDRANGDETLGEHTPTVRAA